MKKKMIILLFGVGVVIISTVVAHYASNKSYKVSEKDNIITISNYNVNKGQEVNSININNKDIEKLEYFPGIIIMNGVPKDQQFTRVKSFKGNLARGIDNVNIISTNNNGSGVYIKEKDTSYVLLAKTKEETKNLYNKLEAKENFTMKC